MNEKVKAGRPKVTMPKLSLDAFDRRFPDEDSCRQYLADLRWPDGVTCPRCKSAKVYKVKQPWKWQCQNPDCDPANPGKNRGYRFSVLTGTIFEDTKYPLKIWFKVGYLMLSSKKGVSALQIYRMMAPGKGSDYRTFWFMCHRLRAAMRGDFFRLEGEVEVDETYIGGKDRNRHWNKKSAQQRAAAGYLPVGEKIGYGKVGVIGAIARKGNVVARVIGEQDACTLSGFVRNVVSEKVSLVATDENREYNYIDRNIPHEAVNHSRNEWVRGEVHTNNIESFWALLKRGVVGTFHNVSKDYLPLYLNEFSFRHNYRQEPDQFALLISSVSQG